MSQSILKKLDQHSSSVSSPANHGPTCSHVFSGFVASSWVGEVPLHPPNIHTYTNSSYPRIPYFIKCISQYCFHLGYFFFQENQFFSSGFKSEKFAWMSNILEMNIWTAEMMLQEIIFYIYERNQASSPHCSFIFPLRSSYPYSRISS